MTDDKKKRIESICNGDLRHSVRTMMMAGLVGQKMGWDEDRLYGLDIAALFHDAGKASISRDILCKQGPLDNYERSVVRQHPIKGAGIIQANSLFRLGRPVRQLALQVAAFHHERLDGTGYPFGLRDEQIPMEARIVTVCDIYDALRSDRPYREAIAPGEAWEVLKAERGLDNSVMAAFAMARPYIEEFVLNVRVPGAQTVDHILANAA